jgi:hypothetical protein
MSDRGLGRLSRQVAPDLPIEFVLWRELQGHSSGRGEQVTECLQFHDNGSASPVYLRSRANHEALRVYWYFDRVDGDESEGSS